MNPNSKTAGLLRSAVERGEHDKISWREIRCGDLIITVASDAMKATLNGRPGVRLPVSYQDAIAICQQLDCVAPTRSMCDAMFAQASAQLNYVGLVRTPADARRMTTVDFTLRFHDGIERQLAASNGSEPELVAGAWKHWILHPRIIERGAVNYGFWDKRKTPPRPIQSVGGRHGPNHYDYSQLLQPVKRMARHAATGEESDLLDYIPSSEGLSKRFLQPYAPQQAALHIASATESVEVRPVDVLGGLLREGIDIASVTGWQSRGRRQFAPAGIMVHHTAGPSKRFGDAPSLNVCVNGRPDVPGPLCHILVARSGRAHLIAANRANHAGRGAQEVLDLVRAGEPVVGDARNNKYRDAIIGNEYFYGIEVENMGRNSDPYPDAQLQALGRICALICCAHGWSPHRVIHHRQWTRRKIDMSWRGSLQDLMAEYLDAA